VVVVVVLSLVSQVAQRLVWLEVAARGEVALVDVHLVVVHLVVLDVVDVLLLLLLGVVLVVLVPPLAVMICSFCLVHYLLASFLVHYFLGGDFLCSFSSSCSSLHCNNYKSYIHDHLDYLYM
jgi:hypothetical protein